MAEESKNPEAAATPVVPEASSIAVQEVVVTETEKPAEKSVEIPPEEPAAEKPVEAEAPVEEQKITQQVSFKEETNVVSELPESQRKALEDLKKLIQEACQKHEFIAPPPASAATVTIPEVEKPAEEVAPAAAAEEPSKTEETPKTEEPPKTEEHLKTEEAPKTEAPDPVSAPAAEEKAEEKKVDEEKKPETTSGTVQEKTVEAIKETIVEVATQAPEATTEEQQKEEVTAVTAAPEPQVEPEEVSIWGIPLLADERSDVILLKFLRARDFRVKDAFVMIKDTVRWRKEFGVDALLDEDLGSDYEKVVFTHGHDKEGRPVCYNVFGEFKNKELYQNTFADAEKRKKFLRWLIQFLEKTIRTLDFSPKGINSFVLVNDLKNSPGYGKRDLYKVIDKFLEILQDNYPEFVAKQLCINVSWWYLAYNWIYLTVFTPRSKSKFVFASPSKTAETIFKYIAPEQVPIQFGGHSKDGESEFSSTDPVTEVTIKPGGKHPIEFALLEPGELVWELRVIGWDVSYGAEFLPTKEGAYTLNIAKPRKLTPTDEPVIGDTFKATEPGKVVITIDNQSSKKKKLLYRSKVKAFE